MTKPSKPKTSETKRKKTAEEDASAKKKKLASQAAENRRSNYAYRGMANLPNKLQPAVDELCDLISRLNYQSDPAVHVEIHGRYDRCGRGNKKFHAFRVYEVSFWSPDAKSQDGVGYTSSLMRSDDECIAILALCEDYLQCNATMRTSGSDPAYKRELEERLAHLTALPSADYMRRDIFALLRLHARQPDLTLAGALRYRPGGFYSDHTLGALLECYQATILPEEIDRFEKDLSANEAIVPDRVFLLTLKGRQSTTESTDRLYKTVRVKDLATLAEWLADTGLANCVDGIVDRADKEPKLAIAILRWDFADGLDAIVELDDADRWRVYTDPAKPPDGDVPDTWKTESEAVCSVAQFAAQKADEKAGVKPAI